MMPNQVSMTGPKKRATFSVPLDWTKKRPIRMAMEMPST